MDSNARKAIHEIANRLKLKSKSAGSGDQRRPTLHKTKGTPRYTESSFNMAFTRFGKRFLARPDVRTRVRGPQNSRANHSAAKVHEGEIVGGSAPEISNSNKGRMMLEKMGWSNGLALGAIDNKGIVQPIEHVVKHSKAGLG